MEEVLPQRRRTSPAQGPSLSPLAAEPRPGKKAWGAPLSIPKGVLPPNPSPTARLGGANKSSPGRRGLTTLEIVSTQRKATEDELKAASMRDASFKEIVGKYWQAMTGDGRLSSVNFSLYNLVHMRISKTLEPSFSEDEAREVALEDFRSDTKGKPEMKRSQLSHSLYELACVWAKSQMEQSGLTCETQHLVYFLAEMFKNIAEELIIEARRVVKLKELEDIKAIGTEKIAVEFRQVFNVDAAKQKLLAAAAQAAAAEEEERIRAERAEAARLEALRKRNLAEARRQAAECAAWEREMARHQQELTDWMRTFRAAKARVGQAAYELGREEQLALDQRKELESLMRAQVQLALATGGQLIPGGQLLAMRARWEELSRLLAGTEQRIAEQRSSVEDAEAALSAVPRRPPAPIRRGRSHVPPVKHTSAWS